MIEVTYQHTSDRYAGHKALFSTIFNFGQFISEHAYLARCNNPVKNSNFPLHIAFSVEKEYLSETLIFAYADLDNWRSWLSRCK